MQMYTGTRLTTAIHRRLFSQFFLREWRTSVQRLPLKGFTKIKQVVLKKMQIMIFFLIHGSHIMERELLRHIGITC